MKRLILGRHSIASNYSENNSDFDRKLTPEGKQLANRQIKLLVAKGINPELVVSSDATRAMQTTETYTMEMNYTKQIQWEHFLYEDYTTQDFLNFIASISNSIESVMIVGHNPTLATMAARLVPNFYFGVNPATLIVIDFEINNWQDVEVGKGELVDILLP